MRAYCLLQCIFSKLLSPPLAGIPWDYFGEEKPNSTARCLVPTTDKDDHQYFKHQTL